MTIETNYVIAIAIAIAALRDRLKNRAPLFQPMKSETETNCSLCARFSPRFAQDATFF